MLVKDGTHDLEHFVTVIVVRVPLVGRFYVRGLKEMDRDQAGSDEKGDMHREWPSSTAGVSASGALSVLAQFVASCPILRCSTI